MATSITTLQSRIASLLGSEVDDEHLSQAELLADINQAYRFDIPDLVREGRFREGITVAITAGTSGRTSINSDPTTALYGAILGTWAGWKNTADTRTTDLHVYTSIRDFREAYDPALTDQARPTGILIEETEFTLRPIPLANGTVYLDALRYRTALAQNGEVTLDYEAKVIEYMAAGYAAIRVGDDDTAKRMDALAGPLVDKLKSLGWRSASVPIIVGRGF